MTSAVSLAMSTAVSTEDDMKKLDKDKTDYSKIMKYYKRKLVDYDAIRTIKNQCKSGGKYIKVKEVA